MGGCGKEAEEPLSWRAGSDARRVRSEKLRGAVLYQQARDDPRAVSACMHGSIAYLARRSFALGRDKNKQPRWFEVQSGFEVQTVPRSLGIHFYKGSFVEVDIVALGGETE